MAYQIVTAETIEELEQSVNRLCAEGWQPQGSMGVQTYAYRGEDGYEQWGTVYTQAMVRETKPKLGPSETKRST